MSRKNLSFASTGLVAILSIALMVGRWSRHPTVRFSEPGRVSTLMEVGTAPMFAVSNAGTQAVAWVSAPDSGTDGRLYISVGHAPPVELTDSLGPVEAHGESPPKLVYSRDGSLNALYVVPKVVPGERFPRAALRFTRSADGDMTWTAPVSVTDDAVFGTHNFHAMHAAADGSLYVSWLDKRGDKTAPYLTRSTDGGKTWETNRRVGSGEACPCCRTAITTAATGTLYVGWRQVNPDSTRDIVISRSDDHGNTWSDPVRVHNDAWNFPGCPHAGPSLQVDGKQHLHVAWWTGKEGIAGVWYTRSEDGGKTFVAPIALGVASYSQPSHVQMALGPKGEVVVAWDDGTKEVSQVVVRVSRDQGRTFGPAEPVSLATRAAGFPVLALSDSTVTVAWSEESAETAKREKAMMAAMPKNAPMGPHPIGEAQVMVRRGHIS